MLSLPYILASSGISDELKESASKILERTAPLSQISGSLESLLRPMTYDGNTTVGEAVSRAYLKERVRITKRIPDH